MNDKLRLFEGLLSFRTAEPFIFWTALVYAYGNYMVKQKKLPSKWNDPLSAIMRTNASQLSFITGTSTANDTSINLNQQMNGEAKESDKEATAGGGQQKEINQENQDGSLSHDMQAALSSNPSPSATQQTPPRQINTAAHRRAPSSDMSGSGASGASVSSRGRRTKTFPGTISVVSIVLLA